MTGWDENRSVEERNRVKTCAHPDFAFWLPLDLAWFGIGQNEQSVSGSIHAVGTAKESQYAIRPMIPPKVTFRVGPTSGANYKEGVKQKGRFVLPREERRGIE